MRAEKIFTLCCEVNVEPANPGSSRFHERLGFKTVKKHTHEPGYIVNYMVKSLTQKGAAATA